jgi:hypothetical protein
MLGRRLGVCLVAVPNIGNPERVYAIDFQGLETL